MFQRTVLSRIFKKQSFQPTRQSTVRTSKCPTYKKWHELSLQEKHIFITNFVDNYKKQYPGSKTNVSLRGLATGIDEHNDSPSVFGIFYNDICTTDTPSTEIKGSRFSHPSFRTLLIKK